MNEQAVESYVDRSRQLLETSPQMDEENTKVKLVQPLIELLGWDLYSTEVSLEYPIRMASTNTHVDYALLVGDSPVVFVEAKPARNSLSDDSIQQLRSYMRQELDVDWGILTNGRSFEVLSKNRQNGRQEVSVVQFDLGDLAESPGLLEILTKESIRSGRSDEVDEQVARTNEAIRRLEQNENQVTATVEKAIEEEIGELTINLEEQAREFVQGLASVLREQRQFVSDETWTDVETATEQNDRGGDSETAQGSQESDVEGYVVRFSDGHVVPSEGEEPHLGQKENMGAAVDYLIEEYNLIGRVEIPCSPPRARKNCSINSKPEHPNGEEMRVPYELTNGYYLHAHMDAEDKKSRIRDLADTVDVSVEFLGDW